MGQDAVALLSQDLQDEHGAMKGLLARIRDHEMYPERVFSDLLKEVQQHPAD